ncbi:hypothetical protein HID58_022324 [Brassica napus]|uniref:Chalcone synthase n=1 Tax=Brassica napus TaxID=3708 RepID=A0ABQ8CYY4_BRANA|nr:hypothetical protein HID58_022324 [Brassica napus]
MSDSTIICAFSLASVIALHLAFSIFGTDRSAFSALQASSNLRATSILHRLYANFSRETWETLKFRWRKLSFLTINYFVGDYLTQLIFVLSVPFPDFKEVQRLNLWHEVFDTSLSEIPASSSLSLDVVVVEVPKIGKEAGVKTIKEWGQPKSKIKQVVFCTTSGVDMPGADHQLTKLLGLRPSVKRLMMYQQGCFAGGTVLRLAKDLAENNRGARVSWSSPRSQPSPSALFSDGAAALIVGSDADISAAAHIRDGVCRANHAQNILPDSDGAIDGHLREVGLTFHLFKDVPGLISKNIEKSLDEAFKPLGIVVIINSLRSAMGKGSIFA